MKVYFNKEQSITYQFDLIYTLFSFDNHDRIYSSVQSLVFYLSYDLLRYSLREEARAKSEITVSRECFG